MLTWTHVSLFLWAKRASLSFGAMGSILLVVLVILLFLNRLVASSLVGSVVVRALSVMLLNWLVVSQFSINFNLQGLLMRIHCSEVSRGVVVQPFFLLHKVLRSDVCHTLCLSSLYFQLLHKLLLTRCILLECLIHLLTQLPVLVPLFLKRRSKLLNLFGSAHISGVHRLEQLLSFWEFFFSAA